MLLIMYQIFSSLLSHLPFLVYFLLHFYGVTFFGTPNIKVTSLLEFQHKIRKSLTCGFLTSSSEPFSWDNTW